MGIHASLYKKQKCHHPLRYRCHSKPTGSPILLDPWPGPWGMEIADGGSRGDERMRSIIRYHMMVMKLALEQNSQNRSMVAYRAPIGKVAMTTPFLYGVTFPASAAVFISKGGMNMSLDRSVTDHHRFILG